MAEEEQSASPHLPVCLNWTKEEVSEWIASLGFPQYKECFLSNFITGRKLIWIKCSTLPRLGITDWKHIQYIVAKVNEMLMVKPARWDTSISLPYRCELGIFLERKSFTGARSDKLVYRQSTAK